MPEFLKTGASPKTNGGAQTLDVPAIVKGVIDDIRARGDEAVRSYSEKFDKWSPASFRLSKSQIDEIISTVPEQIVADIKTAQRNVRAFAEAQRGTITDLKLKLALESISATKISPLTVSERTFQVEDIPYLHRLI
uniref:Histidinol dehydrogenase n=1 Tax=Bionectria ochroleuca TaxID=29856 RepID=A0A8H7NJW3_BIOOC